MSESRKPQGSESKPRAPYEAPKIATTGEFETLAAGCAKVSINPRDPNYCPSGKLTTY